AGSAQALEPLNIKTMHRLPTHEDVRNRLAATSIKLSPTLNILRHAWKMCGRGKKGGVLIGIMGWYWGFQAHLNLPGLPTIKYFSEHQRISDGFLLSLFMMLSNPSLLIPYFLQN
ncbi:hypothetical protein, partial [Azonexus sp.]|uniref:hypothetical protein n=1 Tax=Azonexus sp. TaxID=1872668 RepID=UPI002828D22E